MTRYRAQDDSTNNYVNYIGNLSTVLASLNELTRLAIRSGNDTGHLEGAIREIERAMQAALTVRLATPYLESQPEAVEPYSERQSDD